MATVALCIIGSCFTLLVLNKLFCGLSIATPVPAEITPTADELALCDGLLVVDPQERLGSQVGHLSLREMQAVDKAITELLDLR